MVVSKLPSSSGSGFLETELFYKGILLAYQCVNHVFMMRALSRATADECPVSLDGAAEVAATSPHCQEVQMFHRWQKAELQSAQRRLATSLPPVSTSPTPGASQLHQQFEQEKRTMLEKHIEHEEHMLSTLTDASSDPHVAAPNAHVESWAAELSQLREHL